MMRKLGSKIWFFIQVYAYSWLIPLVVALVALGLFLLAMLADLLLKLRCEWLQIALFGVLGVSLFGVLVSAIWNFFSKRWQAGAIQLLVLLIAGIVSMIAIGAVCFALHFAPL